MITTICSSIILAIMVMSVFIFIVRLADAIVGERHYDFTLNVVVISACAAAFYFITHYPQ